MARSMQAYRKPDFSSAGPRPSWQPARRLQQSARTRNIGRRVSAAFALTQSSRTQRIRIACGSAFRPLDFFAPMTAAKPGRSRMTACNQTLGSSCVHRVTHDPDNADMMYRQDHRGMYHVDERRRQLERDRNRFAGWRILRTASLLVRIPHRDGQALAKRVRRAARRRQFSHAAEGQTRRLSHA